MEQLTNIVNSINGIVWSDALVALCLITGLYFSFKTNFLQVRHWKEMLRLLLDKESSKEGISSFQALSVSLSGRVGTGNIVGVAAAIAFGGPGAVFWMWMIAFLGAGSAFVESTLGQIYKVEQDGEYRGGPAYYIEKGLKMKWYGLFFAMFTLMAMTLFLPGTQANSIAESLNNAFNIPKLYSGIFLVVLLGFIIFGGVKKIGKTAEIIVPFMGIAYILVALIIIVINYKQIPTTFSLIFTSAFGVNEALGGILGYTIAWGVKRGIYSNEAGQGTGPHAAAAAEVSHPVKQGLVQAFSVYIDTLFVCTATALMILTTNSYSVYQGGTLESGSISGFGFMNGVGAGTEYTQAAVESVFPGFGAGFIAISLFFFAFTTIMAYYYMAETNVAYITKNSNMSKKTLYLVLRVTLLTSVLIFAVNTSDLAWGLGDIGVGIMAWLNIVAILLLSKPALIALKDYEKQKKEGKDPTFDPKALGIENADFWENK